MHRKMKKIQGHKEKKTERKNYRQKEKRKKGKGKFTKYTEKHRHKNS